MRPLTWTLKGVDPVAIHKQSRHTCSGNLGIVKILRYIGSKQIFGSKMGPLANGALCLNTPKHKGKSGTEGDNLIFLLFLLGIKTQEYR